MLDNSSGCLVGPKYVKLVMPRRKVTGSRVRLHRPFTRASGSSREMPTTKNQVSEKSAYGEIVRKPASEH